MRVVSCMLLCAVLLLPAGGCSLFGKRSSGSGATGVARADRPLAKFPSGPAADPLKGSEPPPNPQTLAPAPPVETIVAGRVMDKFSRPVGNANIQCCLEERGTAGKQVELATDANGYFTIPKLRPGSQYKLIARSRQGEKVAMQGTTYAEAPNPRVVIQISEDLVTNDPPADADRKAETGGKDDGNKHSALGTAQPATAWTANPGGAVRSSSEATLPAQLHVPGPGSTAPGQNAAPPWVPGVTGGGQPAPLLDIQSPRTTPPPSPPQPPALVPGEGKLTPARVPSCVLVGQQLVNLALHDTAGEVWEFRTSKRGKLVLFDFWATYCMPCRQTMPQLARLQSQYGNQGLEVVGIALEASGTPKDQSYRINEVCRRLKTNYRQLLGESDKSGIGAQFNAPPIPLLVLVDENGWILWRHMGSPDQPTFAELERLIQRRLESRGL